MRSNQQGTTLFESAIFISISYPKYNRKVTKCPYSGDRCDPTKSAFENMAQFPNLFL